MCINKIYVWKMIRELLIFFRFEGLFRDLDCTFLFFCRSFKYYVVWTYLGLLCRMGFTTCNSFGIVSSLRSTTIPFWIRLAATPAICSRELCCTSLSPWRSTRCSTGINPLDSPGLRTFWSRFRNAHFWGEGQWPPYPYQITEPLWFSIPKAVSGWQWDLWGDVKGSS